MVPDKIRDRASGRGRASTADKWGWGVSDLRGRQADQSGPTPGGVGADRRGPGAERAGTNHYPRILAVGLWTDGRNGARGALRLCGRRCLLRDDEVTGD
jgi:hypothetical protein